MTANNAINNTLQTPFNVGATSVTSTGAQLNLLNGLSNLPPITKINTQQITATGSYTYSATTGTKYAIFELQAAGGGSGGTGSSAGNGSSAGGGGSGGYFRVLVTGSANLAAISGSIGTAGAAGSNSPGNGGAGGNTTMTINSGTTWTAGGGAGSALSAATTAAVVGNGAAGGTNTVGTNGTTILNCPGSTGGTSTINASATLPAIAGLGGNSFLNYYGQGANGSFNGSGSNAVGTAGIQGILIVTEFISV